MVEGVGGKERGGLSVPGKSALRQQLLHRVVGKSEKIKKKLKFFGVVERD